VQTQVPEIVVQQSPEGATSLQRETYGYIGLAVALGVILCFMAWIVFKSRNQEAAARLADFQDLTLGVVTDAMTYRKQQDKLQQLKPKLKYIEKKLLKAAGSKRQSLALNTDDHGRIQFNARKLFDAMDENGDGELSFKELNRIMKLKPAAMKQFMHKMNQAGHAPAGTDSVSRAIFIRHFLTALEASSHFEPTQDEAAALFDEIAEGCKATTTSRKKGDIQIPHEAFFSSPLANFLNESEINELLKRFQQIQDLEVAGGDTESVGTWSVNTRRSLMQRAKTFRHRKKEVGRNEFIARYPQLLVEITTKNDNKHDKATVGVKKDGIDMTFKNLSLDVKVKDNKTIRVVNEVTGRLRSGTMTALMGGSGAGNYTCPGL